MIWPIITAFVHSIDRRTEGSNLFEGYIRLIILVISLPSLLGIAGPEMQVVAAAVLFFFFKVWPKGSSDADSD